MHNAVDAAVEQLRDEIIVLLQRLVRVPSITGSEQDAQRVIVETYRALGLETHLVESRRADLETHPAFSDDGIPFGDRINAVGRWAGTGGGRSLIINGHIDVVPPGDESEWVGGPWSGEVRDGLLYGRGSCDMKAGVCAAAMAVRALKSIGFHPAGDVLLQSVVSEETGGIGTLGTIVRGYRADACIICEPTGLAIWTAQSGALTFRITVTGRAAHAAMKAEGVSALMAFMPIVARLEQLDIERHAQFRHPLFANPNNVAPISIGVVHAGDWPSTVPARLIAEGRFGIFPGESAEDARAVLARTIAEEAARHPWLVAHPPRLEWFEGQFDSGEIPVDSDIVTVVADAHRRMSGNAAILGAVSAGTDARLFTRYADVPTILYGPGDVGRAHTVNECVSIDEVLMSIKALAHAIIAWCGESSPVRDSADTARTAAAPTS